jgi:hypothetical protein
MLSQWAMAGLGSVTASITADIRTIEARDECIRMCTSHGLFPHHDSFPRFLQRVWTDPAVSASSSDP